MELAFDILRERSLEIECYADLLEKNDIEIKSGRSTITPDQHHIMMANMYLLIYNMVEASVVQTLKIFEETFNNDSACPANFSEDLKREWIRNSLGTRDNLNEKKRLEKALAFYNSIISGRPIALQIARGGGGNWDDEEIFRLGQRLGINLRKIPRGVLTNIKREIHENKGCLKFVVTRRNMLAHGEISFKECGRDEEILRLKTVFLHVYKFLESFLQTCKAFIDERQYINA